VERVVRLAEKDCIISILAGLPTRYEDLEYLNAILEK